MERYISEGNVRLFNRHEAVDDMAFDVHAQDLTGDVFQFVHIVGHLDTARFAAAAYLNLRFHNKRKCDLFIGLHSGGKAVD